MEPKEVDLYEKAAIVICKGCRYCKPIPPGQNKYETHFCGRHYLTICDVLYFEACKKLFKQLKADVLSSFIALLKEYKEYQKTYVQNKPISEITSLIPLKEKFKKQLKDLEL